MAIALAITYFLLANSVGLSGPGLQYDELLFVNAALGATHAYRGFIYSETLGVPTMLMPYIGAVKAWLYAPIFSVFGVTVDSVRLPAVIMAGAAVLLTVLMIRRLLGLWPAVLVAVLLASDPVYGAVSRADWGPIVISSLMRVTALIGYFAFLRTKSVRYLWTSVLALSIGLFNKLDFVWFIPALCVAAAIVHHRELIAIARSRRAAALAPVVFLVVVGCVIFVTLIIPATELTTSESHASLFGRISEVRNLFQITFNGSAVYQYMSGSVLGHPTLISTLFPWILAGCLAVAAWYLIRGRRLPSGDGLREAASSTTFFLIVFAVVLGGIVVTRQATGPQHVMLVWPMPAVLCVCLIATAAKLPAVNVRRVAVLVLGLALAALIASQFRASRTYVDTFRSAREWSPIWSGEIYDASRAVNRSAPQVESVVTADWGLGNQIFALGNEAVRNKLTDQWPDFSSPAASVGALESQFVRGHHLIIVFHAPSAQIMPSTSQRVLAILAVMGAHARQIFKGQQIEAYIISD